jgi:hypothetical protein
MYGTWQGKPSASQQCWSPRVVVIISINYNLADDGEGSWECEGRGWFYRDCLVVGPGVSLSVVASVAGWREEVDCAVGRVGLAGEGEGGRILKGEAVISQS